MTVTEHDRTRQGGCYRCRGDGGMRSLCGRRFRSGRSRVRHQPDGSTTPTSRKRSDGRTLWSRFRNRSMIQPRWIRRQCFRPFVRGRRRPGGRVPDGDAPFESTCGTPERGQPGSRHRPAALPELLCHVWGAQGSVGREGSPVQTNTPPPREVSSRPNRLEAPVPNGFDPDERSIGLLTPISSVHATDSPSSP